MGSPAQKKFMLNKFLLIFPQKIFEHKSIPFHVHHCSYVVIRDAFDSGFACDLSCGVLLASVSVLGYRVGIAQAIAYGHPRDQD